MKDPPRIGAHASNIARRANRVLQVAQQEAENSEDPKYVDRVNEAATNLRSSMELPPLMLLSRVVWCLHLFMVLGIHKNHQGGYVFGHLCVFICMKTNGSITFKFSQRRGLFNGEIQLNLGSDLYMRTVVDVLPH